MCRANFRNRFSVYVFGRVGGDGVVCKVGNVVERELGVRRMLKPYLEPKTEVGDVCEGRS